ncbi:hypothetical protein BpHYR1_045806 [Brachionus plicatilis]|uniref:Uncharacterized protein n=1 Tax=Brachionus plicatilis TaxID=10195 RepID=A0A3M7SZ29_BRAPC|nr:hypothetical protein BpHYR1_045806 [Brachionus plicatilis]
MYLGLSLEPRYFECLKSLDDEILVLKKNHILKKNKPTIKQTLALRCRVIAHICLFKGLNEKKHNLKFAIKLKRSKPNDLLPLKQINPRFIQKSHLRAWMIIF